MSRSLLIVSGFSISIIGLLYASDIAQGVTLTRNNPSFPPPQRRQKQTGKYFGAKITATVTTTLKPLQTVTPQATLSNNLSIFNTLKQQTYQSGTFTFTLGGKISQDLIVDDYVACAIDVNGCGSGIATTRNPNISITQSAGAAISAFYNPLRPSTIPGGINPLPNSQPLSSLRWIQVVEEKETPPKRPTITKVKVDGLVPQGTVNPLDPFYPFPFPQIGNFDREQPTTQTFIMTDTPQRGGSSDILARWNWTGYLFLARLDAPGQVTLFENGFSWGWDSNATNVRRVTSLPYNVASACGSIECPDTVPYIPPPFECYSGNLSCCSCIPRSYASSPSIVSEGILDVDAFTQLDESILEAIDVSEETHISKDLVGQSPTPVPTPALLPSIVATGIWHGRKWRKRKHTETLEDQAA
jgi:hypothetical protein